MTYGTSPMIHALASTHNIRMTEARQRGLRILCDRRRQIAPGHMHGIPPHVMNWLIENELATMIFSNGRYIYTETSIGRRLLQGGGDG